MNSPTPNKDFPDFLPTVGGAPDRSPLFARLRFAAELLADAGTCPERPFIGYRQKDRSVCIVPVETALVIGREIGCDLVIADDAKLGRRHLRIEISGNRPFLEDLSSKNGTYVNDSTERVQRRELRDGDLIFAGSQIFLFANPTHTPALLVEP